ncbi:hypothetical protein WN990_39120 [Kitasatospora purpeofusca]|uniref:hypothetical protein n=1 Tax=Kitasatospora purpeofusca TaxID=67352 RepID=UPI0030F093D7
MIDFQNFVEHNLTTRIIRPSSALVAATLAGAVLFTAASSASATVQPQAVPLVNDFSGASLSLNGSALEAQGYTFEQVAAELADNPNVRVERTSQASGEKQSRGVSIGWNIYVTLSQTQARAILYASSAAAAGIIGLATGGVGGVVAGVIYAYIGSIGSDGLNQCARWKFTISLTGKLKSARCA